MSRPDFDVLGIFPAIGPGRIGGVQRSGQLAWDAVSESLPVRHGTSRLFCYQPSFESGLPVHESALVDGSKLKAIRTALLLHGRPRLVLVWHIALLRLLPFFRVGNAPVVLFLHGIEAWRRHDPVIRFLLHGVTLFLTNSAYTWERFASHYPSLRDRTHQVVHLGMGVPSGLPSDEPNDPPAALMLSRLLRTEDYKGHRELLAAWPHVATQLPGAQLWIAGGGDLRADLERWVTKHALTVSVHFFGQVSVDQKQELLHRCRAFVLPSRGEGFGLVYLEAMRLGRPCLVSDCDGGREVVNPPEAGIAADPDDAGALADALCRLLSPGAEWERLSQAACRRYDGRFTAVKFQARLLAALEPYFV